MCCLHAEIVCKQIKDHIDSMYTGQLTVDWVGTGPHGRSDGENRAIIRKFCPDKVDGKRRAEDIKLDDLRCARGCVYAIVITISAAVVASAFWVALA